MDDIAPALLEKLQDAFEKELEADPQAAALLKLIRKGKATYETAGNYAEQVANALTATLGSHLSGAVLPDGKLYWNLADRVLRPLLERDHALVSEAAVQVQTALNRAASIGIKAQAPPLNTNRVDGLLNMAAAAAQYDEAAPQLLQAIPTFSRSVVDDALKANVDFQGKAGLYPKIIRTAESHCCEWCSRMAGVYEYPGVPKDVYRRHARCRCVVEYDPGSGKRSGKRQDVWTKRWTGPDESDKIKARRAVGLFGGEAKDPKVLMARSSGQPGATDGHSVLNSVEPIDFGNKRAVADAVSVFLQQHSDSPVEHAIVISPNGHIYRLTGIHGSVNTSLVGEDALRGSIGAHNHPVWDGFNSGDSFSREDVIFSVEHKTGMEYLTSGVRRNAFVYSGELSPQEMYEAYNRARDEVRQKMFEGLLDSEFEQEETVRLLATQLEGFEFHERL
nr:MAG TPA: hypothetical protein [Caudoviricetes sp.]